MMRIVLIGMMGAGKSKLGKKLAHDLACSFVDSDKEIERLEGQTIAEIFKTKGEAYFRECERKLLSSLEGYDALILSVGGGFPCFNGMMNALNSFGTTIYLNHTPEFLFSRLLNNRSERPLIKDLEPEELKDYLKDLLTAREAYYLKAHYRIDRAQQTPKKVIDLLGLQKS